MTCGIKAKKQKKKNYRSSCLRKLTNNIEKKKKAKKTKKAKKAKKTRKTRKTKATLPFGGLVHKSSPCLKRLLTTAPPYQPVYL